MTDPRRYHAIYLAALPSGPRAARVAPPLGLDTKHFYPPMAKRAASQFSLPQLYVAGIDCGNAEAREELKRLVIATEPRMTALNLPNNWRTRDAGTLRTSFTKDISRAR
jgi:hypothetical protein